MKKLLQKYQNKENKRFVFLSAYLVYEGVDINKHEIFM